MSLNSINSRIVMSSRECIGKQVMFRKDHMNPARENLVGYFRQGYFLETSTLINQPQTYKRGKYNTTGGY